MRFHFGRISNFRAPIAKNMNNAERQKIHLVIMPAYNEAVKIGLIVDKIKEQGLEADILVVDDGSFDNTAEIAENHGALVISLPINLGYGAALETGYVYAYENGYDYVLQMDADGQHEPKCLKDLISEIKKGTADLVIGSRYLKDCGYKTTFARKIGTVILFWLYVFYKNLGSVTIALITKK